MKINAPAMPETEGLIYCKPLFDFPATLLPISLAGKSCLDPFFFSRLQVERMPLDLFNDVFLLHFPFEAPEGVFQCFALLESDFCQMNTPPDRSRIYFSLSAARNATHRGSIDIIWA